MILFLLFFGAQARADSISTSSCSDQDVYEVEREACKEGLCKLRVRLKRGKRQLSVLDADPALFYLPSGKIQKTSANQWWIDEAGDANGDQGKTSLQIQEGRSGANHKTLLISSEHVTEGGGLPAASYHYFVCEGGKLNLAWEGNDDGSAEMSSVKLTSSVPGSVSEIMVSGGSFVVGGQTGLKSAVFVWNPKRKKMELKK